MVPPSVGPRCWSRVDPQAVLRRVTLITNVYAEGRRSARPPRLTAAVPRVTNRRQEIRPTGGGFASPGHSVPLAQAPERDAVLAGRGVPAHRVARRVVAGRHVALGRRERD